MSYFAVLRNEQQDFEITRCHLNLWSLPALGSRFYFWDVGLHIKAGEQGLKEFQLTLPFGTAEDSLIDLYGEIRQQDIAELIFSKKVSVHEHSIDLYSSDDSSDNWKTKKVSSIESKQEVDRSGSDYSFWTINLASRIPQGEEGYLRIRFKVMNIGSAWTEIYWRHGAVVDLRVADIRGAVDIEKWRDLDLDCIVPITNLYLFVIAPALLVNRAVHPDLHYARLYEGDVWNSYLGRHENSSFKEKLTIYEWRAIGTDESNSKKVGPENPFRAFLTLSREPTSVLSFWPLAVVLVVFLIALAIGFFVPTILGLATSSVWAQAVRLGATVVSAVGVVGLIELAILLWRAAQKRYRVRKWYLDRQIKSFQQK